MNEQLKNRLIQVLFSDTLDAADLRDDILFGRDYKGLYNMTDQELLEEYEAYADDDDELLNEVRAELAINKMLEPEQI